MQTFTIGGQNSSCVISPVGGTVQRLVLGGKDVIFPFVVVDKRSRGGIPICFPFFGPPTQRFAKIPQHGWLRHESLQPIHIDKSLVSFVGANKPSEDFPWSLEYRVTAKLDFNGFTLLLTVKRLKDGHHLKPPINPAFHPYFWSNPAGEDRCIAKCLAKVGDNVISNFSKESWKRDVDSPILIDAGTQTVAMILGGAFNPKSSLTHWSDNPDAYFCVEPKLTDEKHFDNPFGGCFLNEEEEVEISMRLAVD